ncbi:hypothetical protein HNR59_001251 [Aquamicrobium lusatiense]|uniref:Twin-arginine translocation pathway signal n=1 Tax=Aquamicrobium lusatiense TaxID=89772 RepID=A0A7W9S0K6_9HYPH|nr:hypothetical protein [Aquamicrobium lusatiense]MBB6011906.1 hypothetical protein [Aquamicrobium lusatiense]
MDRRKFLSSLPAMGTVAICPAMAEPAETPMERAYRLERELMETVAGILGEDTSGWRCIIRDSDGGTGTIKAVLRFAHLPRKERDEANRAYTVKALSEALCEMKAPRLCTS